MSHIVRPNLKTKNCKDYRIKNEALFYKEPLIFGPIAIVRLALSFGD